MADALAAKEKGNASFRKGDWYDAVGHYSAAVFADRANPTYPLNRAAAYLKLGKNEDAERDCSTTLNLDAKNVKALYRRAQAREALGKTMEAQLDLAEALRLEPSNATVKKDLDRLRDVNKSRTSAPPLSPANNTVPRRKRIPITIVEAGSTGSESTAGSSAAGASPSGLMANKRNAVGSVSADNAKPATTSIEPIVTTSSTRPSSDLLKPVATRILSSSPSTSVPSSDAPVARPSDAPNGETSPIAPEPPRRLQNGGIFRPTATSVSPASAPSAPSESRQPALTTSRAAKAPPANLFEFEKEWNAAGDDAEKWELVRVLPPSSVRKLFGQSLTPQLLLGMVDVVQNVLNGSSTDPTSSTDKITPTARTFVTALPSIDRFSMITMFMSASEKQRVSYLLKTLGVSRGAWGL